MAIYLDAGTTYSKVISQEKIFDEQFCLKNFDGKNYYILPSKLIKSQNIVPTHSCGHMAQADENEIIALANGALKSDIDNDATVLDMGSRDAKWIKFKNGKFSDMDWNTSCASSTGATVEMLMKFYDVNLDELEYNEEKYVVTCGIFGMEKIMDSISNGIKPAEAISKFIHGISYNAWNFAQKPDKIYLSGGFCQNQCFIDSMSQYCEVVPLGRFLLCEGLIK
jgi:activator of 2-hydroxyglutaryl-CoA dehydratase